MKTKSVALFMMLGYILGVHKGYVALWTGNDTQPCQVYPVPAALLPAKDLQKLSSGIPIENEAQLQQYLEDYLS